MTKIWNGDDILWLKTNYPNDGLEALLKQQNKFSRKQLKKKISYLKLNLNKGARSKIVKDWYKEHIPLDKIKTANDIMSVATKECAYALGLIWADGYIHQKSNRLVLKITKSDAEEITPIMNSIGKWNIQYPTIRNNWKPTKSFDMNNSILVPFLAQHDYHSKSKESACKILAKIPENYLHLWFLALMDGDGYIAKKGYHMVFSSSFEQDWTYLINICEKLSIQYRIKQSERLNKKRIKLTEALLLKFRA